MSLTALCNILKRRIVNVAMEDKNLVEAELSVNCIPFKYLEYLFLFNLELAIKLMLNRAHPFTTISHKITGFESVTLQLNSITYAEVGQI